MTLDLVVAGLLAAVGLAVAVRSLGHARPGDPPRTRLLIALHDTARAGFWLSLGAYFLGQAVLPKWETVNWVLAFPLAFAAIRLVTGFVLANTVPPEGPEG